MNTHCDKKPTNEMLAMERLWNRIKAEFATRKDVLLVAEGLRRLEEADSIKAVQSGDEGPVFPVGNDGVAHVKYENWVEGRAKDAAGREVITYNESTNALTTAAAAMVLKSMRADIKRVEAFKVIVCENKDSEGHPIVESIDYNALYLTPGGDGEDDSNWDEWICVQQKSSRQPYRWEHLGPKKVDLKWVRKDLGRLNKAIEDLAKRTNSANRFLAKAIIEKAVKPLEDLKAYINSPEFIEYVFKELPRASMGSDGLMSANSFAILSMLAIWASNDHKVMGGGALGPDVVIHLLDKAGVPVDDLKKKYHHHGCCICED